MTQARRYSSTKGFARAASLMQSRIRTASESRGFAVSRLLTHWAEVVGPDTAAICRPVKINFGRGKELGATLVVLTTGPQAPMLEMQKDRIREKVNACYGYGAINRVQITQTAPTGFAEGQAVFSPDRRKRDAEPDPGAVASARQSTDSIESEELRLALERLGSNVIARQAKGPDRRQNRKDET
ncbi:DUF721 domain-containing protein [Pelagovum pacificum]|uniref:DUF721 domain-containing protein n=1 Tax=Pelagovum pacificum TaxID=2588711 RepID=A0A5C5GK03_9RHOB|nr:DUF721 domain-containing protein [Pelagovum pacificum]QQA43060.1 DUF721 domain-containing protein [Pelagovum pacificum]TNY33796.1 DUF721 domain-containing protein [Pelagovum pacificum]